MSGKEGNKSKSSLSSRVFTGTLHALASASVNAISAYMEKQKAKEDKSASPLALSLLQLFSRPQHLLSLPSYVSF